MTKCSSPESEEIIAKIKDYAKKCNVQIVEGLLGLLGDIRNKSKIKKDEIIWN